MPTCLHCSARIPADCSHCHQHYQEALRLHERDLASFQEAMDRWSRLNPAVRTLKDEEAEADELGAMATLVTVFTGGYLWYQVNAVAPIDGLWGVGIMLATGFLLLGWAPARRLIGKLARAAFVALPPLIYSLLGLGFFCLISATVRDHALPLFFGMVGVVMLSSLIMEWMGQHHSTGMPAQPVEPRP